MQSHLKIENRKMWMIKTKIMLRIFDLCKWNHGNFQLWLNVVDWVCVCAQDKNKKGKNINLGNFLFQINFIEIFSNAALPTWCMKWGYIENVGSIYNDDI